MKTALTLILLLLPAFCAAQYTDMYTRADTSYATTTWTKIEKSSYVKIFYLEITSDTTSGTAKLLVALEDDTTATRRFSLKANETLELTPLNVSHVYVRSSAGSVPYRVRYH